MIPASLSAVLARIGAIQSRFGVSADTSEDANGGTSTFANVLNQVSGGAGTGSNIADELSKLPQGERELIITQARREGVDPALALAVVLQESGGNPNAVSPAGALGLMQLMPGTVQELGVSKPLDPTQNLAGGLDYLKQKVTEFGSVPLGLAAYNAGSGAVSSWGGVPPYPETQSYVSNILRARDDIARQLASGTTGATGTTGTTATTGAAGTDPTHRDTAGAAGSVGSGAGTRAGQGSAPTSGTAGGPKSAAPGSTGGAQTTAPASTGGAKSGAPTSVDGSQPHGMAPVRGAVADFAFVRGGQAAGAVDGRGASPNGAAANGAASIVQARVADAAGTAGTGKDAGRRGADAAPTLDLGGVRSGNGGQAQAGGGGYQGVGQGMNQAPQGGAASGLAPSAGTPSPSAGSQARGADGPAAGTPSGGSVSHVTIRSGGDQPVTVTLTDRADAVSARVVTQTPAMAQSLRDHAGALRSALASHQVQLSDLAVRPASSDRPANGHPHGGSHRSPRSTQPFQTTMPDSEEDTHEQSGA